MNRADHAAANERLLPSGVWDQLDESIARIIELLSAIHDLIASSWRRKQKRLSEWVRITGFCVKASKYLAYRALIEASIMFQQLPSR